MYSSKEFKNKNDETIVQHFYNDTLMREFNCSKGDLKLYNFDTNGDIISEVIRNIGYDAPSIWSEWKIVEGFGLVQDFMDGELYDNMGNALYIMLEEEI